jgi:dihydroorotate dehydrogenase (NAD+) catalytic subunit
MVEGVMGLEVGVDSHASVDLVAALTRAAYGELPLIVRLPMERASELAPIVVDAGAAAISLAPPRGTYPTANGELTQGRLYGPAVFPIALRLVDDLSRMGVPVIGAGGIYTKEHADAMLAAGALAVQLDSVFWRGGYNLLE